MNKTNDFQFMGQLYNLMCIMETLHKYWERGEEGAMEALMSRLGYDGAVLSSMYKQMENLEEDLGDLCESVVEGVSLSEGLSRTGRLAKVISQVVNGEGNG